MTPALNVIGTSAPRVDGVAKVTGQATYGADVAFPGMLWCKFVRSTVPHARIVRVDTSRAKALPGVHAVITAEDIPNLLWGRWMRDMPVLARDRVRFIGEKVAAVAAEDPDLAEEAALAVEVEYEELPAIFDPREAMKPDAFRIHEDVSQYEGRPEPVAETPNTHSHVSWSKGDVEAGFRQSDLIFEHEFRTQPAHQGHIETHACIARIDEHGRLQVWDANKMPFRQQTQLAPLMDMPVEGIDFHATAIGGDFGGKGSLMDIPAVCYLAKKTGRPVKCVMSYLEELQAANPRHAAYVKIKTGLKRDGTIVARQAEVVWDSGAYGAFKPTPIVNVHGSSALPGSYNIPNIRVDAYSVYTNSVPRGHVRAPGEPQARFAVESHTDMIAGEMGLDPLRFRLMNCLHEGDTPLGGHPLVDVHQEETIRACAERAGWSAPKAGRWHGRGIAVADRHVGSGFANVRLELQVDGTAVLQTSFPDTGTGSHTVMRQVVAEELGLAPAAVSIRTGGTLDSPSDSGAGGSRVTHVGGQAALGAARALRDELERQGLAVGPVPKPVSVEFNYPGANAPVTCFTAQIAEVAVDPETGQVTVERITSAHDVSTIVHPILHQGQIDGGVAHGLGFALMEDLQMSDGRIAALNLGDYKLPTAKDMPPLETVLVKSQEGPGPHNAKAIGESANTPLAAAIANAVFDASGVRITELPITAEKVYEALQSSGREG
ncbi:MAG: xanthine dehydrogenase family protein molybdopterin-binding subunit [Chloroflexota bacterium]|nr:xanthine dehydrogenase family protein molybdopterin-binding subunit [Chloroflexota bacterium]